MSQPSNQRRGIEPALAQWWDQYRGEQQGADDHRVRVFVRSFAPAPGQHCQWSRVVDGLQSAAEVSLIDGYEVTALGEEVCCCEQCQERMGGSSVRDTIEGLRNWEHGSVQSCGFTERTVNSVISGDQYRALVPPELSFGIYLDNSLSGVFPCRASGVIYRPDEYLNTLLDGYTGIAGDSEGTRALD